MNKKSDDAEAVVAYLTLLFRQLAAETV